MITIVQQMGDANCITHNGTMHADEIFATAFLEMYRENIKVFRTSNIEKDKKFSSNVMIYDVGRGKFDHHQPDAAKRENGITYSSFGLLWKEFGRDFLIKKNIFDIEEVFTEFDKDFVEAIDAEDNGFFPKIEANYKVKTVSSLFKIFNPSYHSMQDENGQFIKAVNIAKTILEEELFYIQGKVSAKHQVIDILNNKNSQEPYLILEEYIPYEETILTHEQGDNILFVAFPSNRGGYAIKTVPKSGDDKTARLPFPEEWAGLSDSDLEKVSGIKGLRFCHIGRFIVSCNHLEAVKQVLEHLCSNKEI